MLLRYLQSPNWRRQGLVLLTLVVMLLFAAHPELRLLIPIVDALGVDVMFMLCGAQVLTCSQAALRSVALPLFGKIYAGMIYFLGISGPGVDASVRTHLASRLAWRVAA